MEPFAAYRQIARTGGTPIDRTMLAASGGRPETGGVRRTEDATDTTGAPSGSLGKPSGVLDARAIPRRDGCTGAGGPP